MNIFLALIMLRFLHNIYLVSLSLSGKLFIRIFNWINPNPLDQMRHLGLLRFKFQLCPLTFKQPLYFSHLLNGDADNYSTHRSQHVYKVAYKRQSLNKYKINVKATPFGLLVGFRWRWISTGTIKGFPLGTVNPAWSHGAYMLPTTSCCWPQEPPLPPQCLLPVPILWWELKVLWWLQFL